MEQDHDEERVRIKAHELWEAEGRPHGRDAAHWTQAREIIAIRDSQGSTLLPRDSGADEPIEEPEEALRNLADFPNLTDQGENLLTSTDREPTFGAASEVTPSVAVPISDQPGIPNKAPAAKNTSTADTGKTAAPAKPVKSQPAAISAKSSKKPSKK